MRAPSAGPPGALVYPTHTHPLYPPLPKPTHCTRTMHIYLPAQAARRRDAGAEPGGRDERARPPWRRAPHRQRCDIAYRSTRAMLWRLAMHLDEEKKKYIICFCSSEGFGPSFAFPWRWAATVSVRCVACVG